MQTIKTAKKSFIFSMLTWLAASSSAVAATVKPNPDCDNTTSSQAVRGCLQNNQVIKDIQTIINALSIGVGIIITSVIIVGGIQYIIAGENPQAIAAAKQRIINALIALAAYLLIFAILQWLVPGGVFG